MEEGYIDEFDIKRIVSAIEEKFNLEQIEKGKYKIEHEDGSGSGPHVVDLKTLHCSCDDFEYNCQPKENELGDSKHCKHLYHSMFRVHSMLP